MKPTMSSQLGYAKAVQWLDQCHWRFLQGTLVALKRISLASPKETPHTIVVLRNCFFGDYVVVIPALRALRSAFPRARIVLLTASSFAAAWRHRPQYNGVFDLEPGLLDQVVHFSNADLRSGVRRAELRAQIGGDASSLSLALCYSATGLFARLQRVVLCRLLGLPFPLGLTGTPTMPAQRVFNRWRVGRPDVPHQYQAALGSVNELLHQYGLPSATFDLPIQTLHAGRGTQSLVIGVAPFTKQPVKQWPLQRFAELMAAVAQETGASFEIYGAPDEQEMAIQLNTMLGGRVMVSSLCGALSPLELRRRLEAVHLLVCLDSGPMHVASLVGTPVVALFSQITLHQFWRPWGPNGTLLSSPVPCAQCDTRNGQCPQGTQACIEGISLDAVLQQVRMALLKTTAP